MFDILIAVTYYEDIMNIFLHYCTHLIRAKRTIILVGNQSATTSGIIFILNFFVIGIAYDKAHSASALLVCLVFVAIAILSIIPGWQSDHPQREIKYLHYIGFTPVSFSFLTFTYSLLPSLSICFPLLFITNSSHTIPLFFTASATSTLISAGILTSKEYLSKRFHTHTSTPSLNLTYMPTHRFFAYCVYIAKNTGIASFFLGIIALSLPLLYFSVKLDFSYTYIVIFLGFSLFTIIFMMASFEQKSKAAFTRAYLNVTPTESAYAKTLLVSFTVLTPALFGTIAHTALSEHSSAVPSLVTIAYLFTSYAAVSFFYTFLLPHKKFTPFFGYVTLFASVIPLIPYLLAIYGYATHAKGVSRD